MQATALPGQEVPVQKVVVLGAGSAGLLTALALQRAFADLDIVIVHSPAAPVIGVGESTTALLPPFLHRSLGLDPRPFFAEVRPSWKLGVRFEWGDPKDTHFNYTFDNCMSTQPQTLRKMKAYYCLEDPEDASLFGALMDRRLSPCMRGPDGQIEVLDGGAYHLDNEALIEHLTRIARQRKIEFLEARVVGLDQDESGDVRHLKLSDDGILAADLFFDCSGFAATLVDGDLENRFVSYESSLPCDSAVVGSWKREGPILPYTTAETMDYGWCWRIDFPAHVTHGYVFSSAFCDDNQAMQELKNRHPQLGDDLRVLRFPRGRREHFWKGNMIAIGNSCGFVEPLEATALHLVVEQIRLTCRVLGEADGRILAPAVDVVNLRFREMWDEVRTFLALHYRFNRKRQTDFWEHCRSSVDLHGAAELVELYREAGPSTMAGGLLKSGRIFGYDGFMAILIGQKVPTRFQNRLSAADRNAYKTFRDRIRRNASMALEMGQALASLQPVS